MKEPITKELREHAADHVRVELLEIADRIDAEYKRRLETCRENTKRGVIRYLRGVLTDYDRNVKRVRKGDKVEVVRCRDCRWAKPLGKRYVCTFRSQLTHLVDGNDFCSNGKRKGEGNA